MARNNQNGFPTLFDVAAEAGLSIKSVGDFYRLKKDDRYVNRIAEAADRLGYVNCMYNLKYKKPLRAVSLIGEFEEYLPAFAEHMEMPVIFNKLDPQDPFDAFQRYGVANVIAFRMPIAYDGWSWLTRNMIFVDCEQQNVFTSVSGFSPRMTAFMCKWLCRYPRMSPINLYPISDH